MAHSGWPTLLLLAVTTVAAAPPSSGAGAPPPSAARVVRAAPPAGTTYRQVVLDAPASRDDEADGGPVTYPAVAATSFTMAGLTWRGPAVAVLLRTHDDAGWSAWQRLDPLLDGPDAGAEGQASLRATDLLWVGEADGAQVRTSLPGDGAAPTDVRLTLIGTTPAAPAPASTRDRHPHRTPRLRPHLHGRASWGADPALRSGKPTYNRTIQQVHVHHTVNSNDYRRADVPGLVRGIYAYHTQSLGWSDIGYNFLVDRFGRTWVGRAGGAGKAVRGAHTLGFNSTSTGVAVIGDYETARPTKAVLRALVHLAAWKLHRYHRDPRGRVWVYSHGSDLFAPGRTVHLPVVDGHRDTNQTACPGRYLYRRLPYVRKHAVERERRF